MRYAVFSRHSNHFVVYEAKVVPASLSVKTDIIATDDKLSVYLEKILKGGKCSK